MDISAWTILNLFSFFSTFCPCQNVHGSLRRGATGEVPLGGPHLLAGHKAQQGGGHGGGSRRALHKIPGLARGSPQPPGPTLVLGGVPARGAGGGSSQFPSGEVSTSVRHRTVLGLIRPNFLKES